MTIIGPPKLTRFERTRIIGARALQITLGAPVLITPPEHIRRPIEIAAYELEAGVLPVTVRRKLPNGTYVDIPLEKLLKAEEEKLKKPR